jgi:CRP-like cAMP-binding protein
MAHHLGDFSLFEGLGEQTLDMLDRRSRLRQMPKNSIIFFQGDPAEGVYLVCQGIVSIMLAHPDGRELAISEMDLGECFGELSVITGQPRSTGAVTKTRCELILIPNQAFLQAIDSEPLLSRRLLEITARRLYSSSEYQGALAFLNAPARLARILLLMDDKESERGFMTVSQSELALWTGSTRQTVATALGRWRRAGWLLTGRGKVMLLNRKALRAVEQQSGLES